MVGMDSYHHGTCLVLEEDRCLEDQKLLSFLEAKMGPKTSWKQFEKRQLISGNPRPGSSKYNLHRCSLQSFPSGLPFQESF
jgi:hypothetical protein